MRFIIEYILSSDYKDDDKKCQDVKDLLSFYETYFYYTLSMFSAVTVRYSLSFFKNLWVSGLSNDAIYNGEFLNTVAKNLKNNNEDGDGDSSDSDDSSFSDSESSGIECNENNCEYIRDLDKEPEAWDFNSC